MTRASALASCSALLLFSLGGCATSAHSPAPEPYASAPYATTIRALPSLALGKSTKGGVAASLGRTTAIAFDSGYEVWVYLVRNEEEKPVELVLLFDPRGVLAKTRVRPSSRTPRTSPSG